jgi:hypothetical protein
LSHVETQACRRSYGPARGQAGSTDSTVAWGEGDTLGGEPDRALELVCLSAVGPEEHGAGDDDDGYSRQGREQDRSGQRRHFEIDACPVTMTVPVSKSQGVVMVGPM